MWQLTPARRSRTYSRPLLTYRGVSRSRPPLRLPNPLRQLLRHPFYPLVIPSSPSAGSPPRFLTERSSEDMLIRSRLSRSRHCALLFAEDEALVEDPGGDDDEGQSDDYAREPVDREQVDQSLSVKEKQNWRARSPLLVGAWSRPRHRRGLSLWCSCRL